MIIGVLNVDITILIFPKTEQIKESVKDDYEDSDGMDCVDRFKQAHGIEF